LGEALDQSGYKGSLTRHDLPLAAYLELHIEQGPILEKKPAGGHCQWRARGC